MAEENKNIKGKINELAVYHTDAYKLAVENGYKGTLVEWLDSLVGKSAYEIAKGCGFEGDEEAWLASLSEKAAKEVEAEKQEALTAIDGKRDEILAYYNEYIDDVDVLIGGDG